MLWPARWRSNHLLAAWGAYWVGLAAVTLTPVILAIVRATSAGPGKASVSASLDGSLLTIVVTEAGRQTLTAAAHALPIALWVAGPPLALYALWAYARSRDAAPPMREAIANPAPDLRAPPAGDASPSTAHVRRATPHR